MLPGMDGFEVCRRLKSDPRDRTRTCGHAYRARRPRWSGCAGLETGADDFLSKPCDEVALLSRVASLIRMKMMVDELAAARRDGWAAAAAAAGSIVCSRTIDVVRAAAFPESRVLIVGAARATRAPGLARALTRAIGCRVETAASEGGCVGR